MKGSRDILSSKVVEFPRATHKLPHFNTAPQNESQVNWSLNLFPPWSPPAK